MNKAKKILALVMCAVLLVGASVAGTVAYLTSQDVVTNTFTVGNVKIVLDEAKVDATGKAPNHNDRVKENEYHLLPGLEYDKDPTVTVKKDSDEAYVRMLVKVTDIGGLKAVFTDESYYGADKVFLLQNLVGGWDPAVWVYEGYTEDVNNGTYEFRYYKSVKKSNSDVVLEDLFKTIKLPGKDVTSENIGRLDSVQIDVVAQAIQTAGFADADEAWDAFE